LNIQTIIAYLANVWYNSFEAFSLVTDRWR